MSVFLHRLSSPLFLLILTASLASQPNQSFAHQAQGDTALLQSVVSLKEIEAATPSEGRLETPEIDAPPAPTITGKGISCNHLMESVNLSTVPPPAGRKFLERLTQGIRGDEMIEEIYELEYGEKLFDEKEQADFDLAQENARKFDLSFLVVTAPGWVSATIGAGIAVWVGNMIRSSGENIDPRNIIFVQERIGHKGKPFMIYKFKTMQDGVAGPAFTQKNDPRVTLEGRVLRRLKLDEFPQILNIIRGEMGIVGPRPIVRKEFIDAVAHDLRVGYRCHVKPGLTSLGQILSPHCKNAIDNGKKFTHELYEILQNKEVPDRLKMILRTPFAILSGKGAS